MNEVSEILDERNKQHGSFEDNSTISQLLKAVMADSPNWESEELTDDQREALEMIVHKIARILSGDPDHVDHWLDVAGYATLVARRLLKDALDAELSEDHEVNEVELPADSERSHDHEDEPSQYEKHW